MSTIDKNDYKIAFKGLLDKEYSFVFDLDNEFFLYYPEGEIKSGACKASIDLIRHHSFLELNVDIEGTVSMLCDRCLEELDLPVQFNSVLIVKYSDELSEPEIEINELEEDILWVPSNDNALDMRQYIYDSINLALPILRAHGNDDNGVSLCDPDMLKRIIIR